MLQARAARKHTPTYIVCASVSAEAIGPENLIFPARVTRQLHDPILASGLRQIHVGMSADQFYAVDLRMDRECARLRVQPH